jgi:adenine-specific DNA methylase
VKYPKRLIEVDLPIKRISAHARREKSIRHGHISTLHIWWARRPLAACRAVICAALWPDPADELCPDSFRIIARTQMSLWAKEHLDLLSAESLPRFVAISKDEKRLEDLTELRAALLDFIADFANWDNSTVPEYLQTSRTLTQAAHEALGGAPGTRPLVVDPFAGGGSIQLEALRIGADAFASDLNPVAVLLNKVVLEYIPKYGERLADEVRKWGKWIKQEAEKELTEFYPKDPDGATPIAYLWARTVKCEGPGCGAEVPLIRSPWLVKKGSRSIALRIIPHPRAKRVDFGIIENAKAADVGNGTVARGSATCPCCGFTTPVASVRAQLRNRKGGAADARLFCVVTTRPGTTGRFYRLPTDRDLTATAGAAKELERLKSNPPLRDAKEHLSPVPDDAISLNELRRISVPIYGMERWGDLFSPRQALALTTLSKLVRKVGTDLRLMDVAEGADGLSVGVQALLALALGRQVDFTSSLCLWWSGGEKIQHVFGRQAIGMVWDYAECNPWSESTGCWSGAYEWGARVVEHVGLTTANPAQVENASATQHPLPNDTAAAVVTDPPYYDAVPNGTAVRFGPCWHTDSP